MVLFFFYASRAPHLNVYPRQAGGNWGVFDWCNQFLQTRVELRDASRMICEGAWREHNVLRTELRFCPEAASQKAIDMSHDALINLLPSGVTTRLLMVLEWAFGMVLSF